MASELDRWAYREADVRQWALVDQTQDRGELRGLADPSVSSDTPNCLHLQLYCPPLLRYWLSLRLQIYEIWLPSFLASRVAPEKSTCSTSFLAPLG